MGVVGITAGPKARPGGPVSGGQGSSEGMGVTGLGLRRNGVSKPRPPGVTRGASRIAPDRLNALLTPLAMFAAMWPISGCPWSAGW
jgi:hypothetical protein